MLKAFLAESVVSWRQNRRELVFCQFGHAAKMRPEANVARGRRGFTAGVTRTARPGGAEAVAGQLGP